MITSSQPYHNRSPYIIILAICALFVLGKTNIAYPITTLLRAMLFPLLEGNKYTQSIIQNEWATFTQLRAQRYQIEQLKEENTRLLAENSFIKILREEQKQWYSQNSVKPVTDFIPVPAVILNIQDTMMLSLKAEAEVPENSIVVAHQHLIGVVARQDQQSVTAYTLKSLPREVPVLIIGKDAIKGRGLLMPSYGTKLEVQRVLQNVPVENNDSVMLLPSTDWPDNIRIGSIQNILKRESDVFQTVEVEQEIEANQLVNVSIYIKKK